jgi:hypothetical protein
MLTDPYAPMTNEGDRSSRVTFQTQAWNEIRIVPEFNESKSPLDLLVELRERNSHP